MLISDSTLLQGLQANTPNQDPKIEHLYKVVKVLWHEVEHLRQFIAVGHREITLKSGAASIVLKADGSVVISGSNITVEGMSRVNVKASGDLILKGANIRQN